MSQHTNKPPSPTLAHSVPEKPASVFAFNELRSCADLQRMVEESQLITELDFQRSEVWTNSAQSTFIDSLARGIPIPSLCIVLESSSERRLVLDGLQRITTIQRFFSNSWRLVNKPNISDALRGKKISEIDKDYLNLINNHTIPITVLRCDLNEPNAYEYLYMIFRRLNTGGIKLNEQELRNCIFSGSFNTLLKELAQNEDYIFIRKSILGRKKNSRFKDEETILRFFALQDIFKKYNGKMSSFLSEYMYSNRIMSDDIKKKNKKLFDNTLWILRNKVIPEGDTQKQNKAFLEGLLIGISRNIPYLTEITKPQAQSYYKKIQEHSLYSADALKAGVTEKLQLISRLILAVNIFSGKDGY